MCSCLNCCSQIFLQRSFYHCSSRCAFKVEMTRTTEVPVDDNKDNININSNAPRFEIEFELIDWAISLGPVARAQWGMGVLQFVAAATAVRVAIDESRFPSFEQMYIGGMRCKSLFFGILCCSHIYYSTCNCPRSTGCIATSLSLSIR
jgi:hypothetical protein